MIRFDALFINNILFSLLPRYGYYAAALRFQLSFTTIFAALLLMMMLRLLRRLIFLR